MPESLERVDVDVALAERSYKIHIGPDLLSDFPALMRAAVPKTAHAIVVFDTNVAALGSAVRESLSAANLRVTQVEIPAGEQSKSIEQLSAIWTQMLGEHTDRGSCVVAVGGGVIGDLAGFAAASYARGIKLVQMPTTLLSQVDSSVGGKTGINLPGAKNIVGAFWQPSLVVIDTKVLDTLPTREFLSGMAEVVKYGVILLPELFEYIAANVDGVLSKSPSVLRHLVAESCRAKASVVQADERETTGLRAILNYGHTFGHAIESTCGYGKYLHGEAISIGMHMAAHLALLLGRVNSGFVEDQRQLLERLNLPTTSPELDPEAMWEVMLRDKKVEHGKLRFVLPTRLGYVELVPGIEKHQALKAIEAACST